MKKDAKPKPVSNSFISMASELRKGMTVSEISDAMAEILDAVVKTGKKGQLDLRFVFVPSSGGETVLVTCQISPKEPVPDKNSTTFFITEDKRLVRHNPNQSEMFSVTQGGAKDQTETNANAATAS
jgi:translation elongation factor P/translation initiation factor 5A